MNLNIIGYLVYLAITAIIIIRVGKICYKNGSVYVAHLIPQHENLCLKINQILLVAYYLFNLGYCAITLINWNTINTCIELLEVICKKTAVIFFLLATLHYLNILIITIQTKKII